MRAIYIHKLWYVYLVAIVVVFLASYLWQPLFYVAGAGIILLLTLSLIDCYILFHKKNILQLERNIDPIFHLGEFNKVDFEIKNKLKQKLHIKVIESLPEVFQVRNFLIEKEILPLQKLHVAYDIKALQRGVFKFGTTFVYVSSPLLLLERRLNFTHEHEVSVFPSTKLFKKFQLMATTHQFALVGNKQMRKVGNSMEFDQIKEYTLGDDIRSVNWKATARKGSLMMNNYIEEKSQNIYCVIDGGRLMQYTFDGLSLLDYAINTTLVLAKVILLKDDRVGLIQYNDKVKDFILADKRKNQLKIINNALFNFQTDFKDSSLEHLHAIVSRKITQRSLLIIYTNFESKVSFDRQLPYFKQLAKKHLVLVVFFENDQVKDYAQRNNETLEDIYVSTIAEKYMYEKKQIIKQLQHAGLIGVMTTPKALQTEMINQYLQLKQRQLI